MKIQVVSFTYQGSQLGETILRLCQGKHEIATYTTNRRAQQEGVNGLEGSLKEWTKDAFFSSEAILFIGACAIAVRSIAPFLQGKTKDPAVLVVDELGKHMISMLSGHIGGGNALTLELAKVIGAEPIITTATDLHEKLAIDVFATRNQLHIMDMKWAKEIAVAILEEKPIYFHCEGSVKGRIPEELNFSKDKAEYKVSVGVTGKKQESNTLYLIPKTITLGIGCKKGKTQEEIEMCVLEVLKENAIPLSCIEQVVSIDLKKEEVGLVQFCQKQELPFVTYSSEELGAVKGQFTASAYVEGVTGVDNVCERSAVLGSEQGTLFINKTAKCGVTVAAAFREWSVEFE